MLNDVLIVSVNPLKRLLRGHAEQGEVHVGLSKQEEDAQFLNRWTWIEIGNSNSGQPRLSQESVALEGVVVRYESAVRAKLALLDGHDTPR